MRHTKPTTTTTTTTTTVVPLHNMESLQLPAELYWDGKAEPNTPPSSELFSIVDYSDVENWIDEDSIVKEIIDKNNLQTIELAGELLESDELVMDICNYKEENWNNVKPQTPTTNYVDEYLVDFSQINPLSKVVFQNEPIIFSGGQEYYTAVVNNLDNAILTQLTPPQSPPLNNINNNNTQQCFSPDSHFIQQQAILLSPQQQQQQSTINWNNQNSTAATLPLQSQATENYLQTQIIDEIVNSRAQELSDWSDEFEALSTSSISSSFTASFNNDESIHTDEDWLPSSAHQQQQQQQKHEEIATTSGNAKKRRPYGRAIEDRKVRKKEQNKNAATRYRQKKKLEMEVVLSEENTLLERHEELKRELLERRKEAKYLKTLLREFYEKQQQLKHK